MHYAALLATIFLVTVPALTAAHGYLSSPPPRGIEKASYQVDDLKAPNKRGLCRGEPVGQITQARPGAPITLGFTITAPHIGPCTVTLLDANLQNERPIAQKMDCAAPGKVGPWTVTMPNDVSGRMVLRWYWEAHHVSPPEPYEQCVDLDFGGGNGRDNGPTFGANPNGMVRAQAVSESALSDPEVDGPDAGPADSQDDGSDGSGPTDDGSSDGSDDGSEDGSEDGSDNGPDDGSDDGSDDSSSCGSGQYQCDSSSPTGFEQCANGAWVRMQCAAGTVCKGSDGTIVCDWP